MKPSYQLFEVVGVELEYPTVRRSNLEAESLVEPLFRQLAGRPVSEVERGPATFSNELADHVFEIKTTGPQRSLREAERILVAGLREVSQILRRRFDSRLLPTGMHPLMDPRRGRIWRRAGRRIYEAYGRLFDLGRHGWMNVQSCHLNLPFGSEEETVALHNAIVLLMPYLPALTASSPIYEGRFGPCIDNRLAFYGKNQRRFPLIAGDVVPEYMTSYAQYRREILRPIYRQLAQEPAAARLRHEWVNSRGAIVRFMRRAIEIRILDVQECVRMDIAFAIFIRAALQALTADLLAGRLTPPNRRLLIRDYRNVVRLGSAAPVAAPHWPSSRRDKRARDVLLGRLESAARWAEPGSGDALDLVLRRLERGNLSERIRRRLSSTRAVRPSRERLLGLYQELADCLEANEPWMR